MIIKLEENAITLLVLCPFHCQLCYSGRIHSQILCFQDVVSRNQIGFRSKEWWATLRELVEIKTL